MRVAFISDIHGNLPALEAVLAELEQETIDRIVCLGDVAVGPQPVETLARVRELGCTVVMGNWDAAFLNGMPTAQDDVGELVNEIHGWWAAQLTEDDRESIRSFVPVLELPLDGVDALCFHGSPRSYNDAIFAITPDEELAPMFAGCRAPLLVGGHTHVQLVRRYERALVVNAGSVGLPFYDWLPDPVRIAPWAEYAVVEANAGRLQVDLRRTPFDVEAYLRFSRESGMPHATWWADCWVVD